MRFLAKTRARRRLVDIGAIAVICAAAATVALVPSRASAARMGGCYGSSCFGRDPQALQCNDSSSYTVWSHTYQAENWASWRADLRYSPTCGAGWLRIVAYSGVGVGFSDSAWNPGGPSVYDIGHLPGTTWTAMVDATGHRQVCGGSQFYVNGQWKRWYFYNCYTR